jgi:hypothetical protein
MFAFFRLACAARCLTGLAILCLAWVLTACSGGSGGGGVGVGGGTGTPRPAAWQGPQALATSTTLEAYEPDIAFDSAGRALAIWAEFDGLATSVIWSSRYTPSTGWGTATAIEVVAQGNSSSEPRLAMDSAGRAVAVWARRDPGVIVANRYDPNTGWGSAQVIDAQPNPTAGYLRVAMSTGGNALAIWGYFTRQGTITQNIIRASRFTPSAGWGTATNISTLPEQAAIVPDIAIDPDGNGLAVWQQRDTSASGFDIWANRYSASSGWGTAQIIEANAGVARLPKVAMDRAGHAIAVWDQYYTDASGGNSTRVWANAYTKNVGWAGPAQIDAGQPGIAGYAKIAIDATGHATAVWGFADAQNNYNESLRANRYSPSSGWGTATQLAALPPGAQMNSDTVLASDASGNTHVVWQQNYPDGPGPDEIWATRTSANAGWTAPEMIAAKNGQDASAPRLALPEPGKAVVLWDQSDGTRSRIWFNRFE